MGMRKAAALAAAIGLVLCMGLVTAAPAMAETGSIRGRVVDAEEGEPLNEVKVCAESVPPQSVEPPCVETEGEGTYEISGLEKGHYRVHFEASNPELEYLPQYFLHTVLKSDAKVLELNLEEEEEVKRGIGAALEKGGWVTGTVTGPDGSALAGVEVCLVARLLPELAPKCPVTDVAGKYETERLPPGPYTAYFSAPESSDIFPQYFDGAVSAEEADDVFVFGYNETAGIDAKMELGSTIAGRVVEAGSNMPLAGIRVCALDSASGAEVRCAASAADGEYSIFSLHAGVYVVGFSMTGEEGGLPVPGQEDGYVRQYFEDEPAFTAADPIDASEPGVYNDIDAHLAKGPEVFPRPSTGSAGSAPPAVVSTPIVVPRPPRCRKHHRARTIKGKRRCVKIHHAHRRRHHHHGGS